jgi:mono/diheme cytochrome c family protein
MTKAPFSIALTLAAVALVGGCQTTGPAPLAKSEQPAPAFIEAACGGCHAVEPPFLSPQPGVPSFEAIANRSGVNDDTLSQWLTDAHNYPEDMDFDLTAEQVDQIAAYIVTLRREDYQPER